MRELIPAENPWGNLSRPFRRGDNAWPVVACQINLNLFGNRLALDGDFGPATEQVARAFQRHRGLESDGIIGPASQERMCRDLSAAEAARRDLPDGLIRGLVENESSYALACVTPHPSGDGFDLGALQDAYYDPPRSDADTQAAYAMSLNVRHMAAAVAANTRDQHDRYKRGGAGDRRAWECATLYHNWPSAADRMARGLGPTAAPDTEAGWVVAASGGRLHTPREWADSYIRAATKYVDW